MKITKQQAMEIIKTYQVNDIQVEDYKTIVFCTPDEEDTMNSVNCIKFTFYSYEPYVRWEVDYYMQSSGLCHYKQTSGIVR